VSPLADPSALARLNERGYAPIELTSVMFRPLSREVVLDVTIPASLRVEVVEQGHEQLWTDIAARGWSEHEGVAAFMRDLGRISVGAEGNVCFLALLDDVPVAAGGLSLHDGTALLAGASTVPEARRQGSQLTLLDRRLRYAVEQGCDLAMMCASPGSASQRNAERHGFRVAYTRIKWRRSSASAVNGA
jgi:GNAT superfamily N-acetyltransferase